MQLPQIAGLPGNRANPTCRSTAPDGPSKGTAHSLQWGALGSLRKTRRSGLRSPSSPSRKACISSSGVRLPTAASVRPASHEPGHDGRRHDDQASLFNEAFLKRQYGYASAVAVAMFVIIFTVTYVYQRIVRVEDVEV
jgi:hypothetical protein